MWCGFAETEIARHTPMGRRQSAPARPPEIQGAGIMHAQYNSPMGLYSKNNVQTNFNNAAHLREEELNW